MKLAISIMTYNRAKHIKEDLAAIAEPAKEYSIGIYIFDGSTDGKTKRIVNEYIELGYNNIVYYHYEESELQQRIADSIMGVDADYIWHSGDKFIVLPQNYEQIMYHIDYGKYDIISIDNTTLNGTKIFTKPEEFAEYGIIPLAHYGATIIRRELVCQLGTEYFKELINDKSISAFSRMIFYMRAIDKRDFRGIVIHVHKDQLALQSKYHTKSESEDKMWEVWIWKWGNAMNALPKRYKGIRKKIVCVPDKECRFFRLQMLVKQKLEGQFDINKCKSYKAYIMEQISLPYCVICMIAVLPNKFLRYIQKTRLLSKLNRYI